MTAPTDRRVGGDALVEALDALDVELVFGLPGVHNLPAWAALARSDIRLVGVRHEQTAVYAADGLARSTGRLGVALTTTGPGAANALGATGEAWASGSPVLVVATDIPTSLRRPGTYRGVLHECRDQGAMFAPVVKEVFRVRAASEIAPTLVAAAQLALQAPTGPVYLEIPTDLLSHPTAPAGLTATGPTAAPAPDGQALDQAARLCAEAARPLLWVGGGALRADAGDAVQRLSAALGAPVIETYMARGLVAPSHPGWVGLPPHLPEVGALWDQADLVIAVGSDFDGMMTQNWAMPQPPRLVCINVDAADAAKNYRPDVVIEGDAAAGADALADRLAPAADAAAVRRDLDDLRARTWGRLDEEEPAGIAFLEVMGSALGSDTVVFADMCIPGYWTAALHPFPRPRQLAYPVGWGTLGFGFPSSIGAALAQEAPVLCVSGDGGFLFACGELAVLAQERVPLTILLIDDGGYGMLRYDQKVAGTSPFGVDLTTPHWPTLAEAFGIRAREVDGIGPALASALSEELRRPEPSLIVAHAELSPPPTTSPRWYRRRGPAGT